MRQLKLFAANQSACRMCRVQFVPLHRDVIQEWERDFAREQDWLAPQSWAVDRVYQENLAFCSPDCEGDYEAHMRDVVIQEVKERLRRKYR